MKAFYFFLLIFFVSIGVAYGQDSTEVVDQIVVYCDNGDTLRDTYIYGHNGKVVKTDFEKRNNGKWENYYINYNDYIDSNEYVSKRGQYVWYNSKWIPRYRSDSLFDYNWYLTQFIVEHWDKENLTESTLTSYINDSKGNALITLVQNWVNGEYINDYRETRTFDGRGNPLTCFRENWQEGLWVCADLKTFSYDKWGNQASEYSEIWKDSIWVKYSRCLRTYDERKNVLVVSKEFWQDDTLLTERCLRTSKTYDSNNEVITSMDERMVDGEWRYWYRINYAFDENGITEAQIDYWEINKWVLSTNYIFKYNSNKFLILYLWLTWENNKIFHAQKQATTFSSDGRSSNLYYQNSEYVNDISTIEELLADQNTNVKWLNVWSQYTEYDAQNRVIFYNLGKWKNDQLEFSDKSTYTYNENGDILTSVQEKSYDQKHWDAVQHSYVYDLNRNRLSDFAEAKYDGKLQGSSNRTFTYNSNSHIIQGQNKILDHTEWKNKDFNFQFNVPNNIFYTPCYKFEVTYKTNTPVKDEITVSGFSLHCSPNPSAGQININYTLTEPAETSISISNLLGFEIAKISENQFQLPGNYNLNYDASNLAPGAYFITIKVGNKLDTKKIQIIR